MMKYYVKINENEYLGYSTVHDFYFPYSIEYLSYKRPTFRGDVSQFTEEEINHFINNLALLKKKEFKNFEVTEITKMTK